MCFLLQKCSCNPIFQYSLLNHAFGVSYENGNNDLIQKDEIKLFLKNKFILLEFFIRQIKAITILSNPKQCIFETFKQGSLHYFQHILFFLNFTSLGYLGLVFCEINELSDHWTVIKRSLTWAIYNLLWPQGWAQR